MKKDILLYILFVFIIFYQLLISPSITGGDLRYIYESMYENYSISPFVWQANEGIGLGGSIGPVLWVYFITSLPIIFIGNIFQVNWNYVVLLGYIIPFLVLSFISSRTLSRYLFPSNKLYFLSPIIYTFNTYILLIIDGGQVLIALSYALAPLTLYHFIRTDETTNKKNIVLLGCIVALQTLFDIRIGFIVLCAIFAYWILKYVLMIRDFTSNAVGEFIRRFFYIFIIPGLITVLLNAFWLLPAVLQTGDIDTALGVVSSNKDTLEYFSFSTLEYTFSLLHPFWPENIFGKVPFFNPLFLLFPAIAFSALIYIHREDKNKKIIILFLLIIGLVGAFLAKGFNPPFEGIYLFLFQYVPGFQLYRDASKWYILLALSYSLLIPYALHSLLSNEIKFFRIKLNISGNKSIIALIVVSGFTLVYTYPLITGQSKGMIAYNHASQDYIELQKFLANDTKFSRTLWIPIVQRYAFYSNTHPSIGGYNYFRTSSILDITHELQSIENQEILREQSVRYIIVPYDSESEIFLKDRKYNSNLYNKVVQELQNIKALRQIKSFGKIAVFELQNVRDHFWSPSEELAVTYTFVNPTYYTVKVNNAKENDRLIFAEQFDKNWIASTENQQVIPTEYNSLNSFNFAQNGSFNIHIRYRVQELVDKGTIISVITLILIGGYLFYSKKT